MRVKYLATFALLISLFACSSVAQSSKIGEADNLDTKMEVNDTLSICTFNIQFLGHFKNRKDTLLGRLLQDYDIVVIQEMVAPPVDGVYPDGTRYALDQESANFHSVMSDNGFNYWLSKEDTGPTNNHINSSGSEWWIVYYKGRVQPDTTGVEPFGFLSDTLVGNSKFKRVPYSFAFKNSDDSSSFNLISVHLNPGGSTKDRSIRNTEFIGIKNWIEEERSKNCDFIILGDCNLEDKTELLRIEQTIFESEFRSLNEDCLSTNTKMYEDSGKGKPYDHIFVNTCLTEEIVENSFHRVDLRKFLQSEGLYNDFFPYEHNYFRTRLSDHVPVEFKIILGKDLD